MNHQQIGEFINKRFASNKYYTYAYRIRKYFIQGDTKKLIRRASMNYAKEKFYGYIRVNRVQMNEKQIQNMKVNWMRVKWNTWWYYKQVVR